MGPKSGPTLGVISSAFLDVRTKTAFWGPPQVVSSLIYLLVLWWSCDIIIIIFDCSQGSDLGRYRGVFSAKCNSILFGWVWVRRSATGRGHVIFYPWFRRYDHELDPLHLCHHWSFWIRWNMSPATVTCTSIHIMNQWWLGQINRAYIFGSFCSSRIWLFLFLLFVACACLLAGTFLFYFDSWGMVGFIDMRISFSLHADKSCEPHWQISVCSWFSNFFL